MRKSVLFLIPNLGHGGAEKVLINLVNNMDHDKYDITVQTLFDEGVNRQYLSSKVKYRYTLKKQFRGNSVLFSLLPPQVLYRLVVKEKYDYVISYLEGPTTRIASGCPYKGTVKIAWIHIELGDDKKYKVGFITKAGATKAYKEFENIVCVSETVMSVFQSTAGVKFPKIEVLYNTNETEKIRLMSKEPIDDVVFDRDMINVCSVAKLMHSKGFDRLAKVHKRLMDEGLKHHIYILGLGEQKVELEKYLAENGLTDTFTFIGYRDNPYKYVAACDLYICSSRREGFSTAVTESLIVGTPVVSTCCSGAHELLGKNNEYGIVTENSEEGIYLGLKSMLQDENIREYYAKKAWERGNVFSTENTVKAVEAMLNRFCK